jgi:hypothetical protein
VNSRTDIGKWFEGEVKDALHEIQERHPATYHRFPDSHAARNLIPAQPADFLLIWRGTPFLIECKCSEPYDNLRSGFSALFPKKQAAQHRKWQRGGSRTILLFCHYLDECVELWNSEPLSKLRAEGRPVDKRLWPASVGSIETLKETILIGAEILR